MLKDAPPEEIAAAVRVVAAGDALLAPAVTRAVIEEFARREPPTASQPAALDLRDRIQAVIYAYESGVVTAGR